MEDKVIYSSTSDLKITPIFSSFLCEGELNIDHDVVYNWIVKQQADKDGRVGLNLNEPELKDMYTEVLGIFNDLNTDLGLKHKQEIRKAWVNVDYDQRFGVAHRHLEALFSAVYYPFVDGDVGHLEMINPNPVLPYVIKSESNELSMVDKFNIYNSNIWRYRPTTGKIVIFPSWVEHFALPNNKESDVRWSIAIDSCVTK